MNADKTHVNHRTGLDARNAASGFAEQLCSELDRWLKTVALPARSPSPSPAANLPADEPLSATEQRHVGGLMRINHTGEVCAQALYHGQALMARDASTRAHLREAAAEEHAHLSWCQDRLEQLHEPTSVLNPFWYGASFMLGAVAAVFGDRVSQGFVIETEKQVEAHLQSHLDQLPPQDAHSRAVLEQMKADEVRHADNARAAGGIELPLPVRRAMAGMSKAMKFLAYRI